MKQKWKKVISIGVFLSLPVSIHGCGAFIDPADAGSQPGIEHSINESQEPYTCVILSTGPQAKEEDCALVSEAASIITKKKFNTTVKIIRYPYTEYDKQLNLMLAMNEKLDLFPNLSLTTATAANNDLVYPLDDLLEEYGSGILDAIPQSQWLSSAVNGTIYGIPTIKEHASSYGYCMMTKILEELGVRPHDIKTEHDVEMLFHLVKQNYPDLWPIAPDAGTMGYYDAYFDLLGGDYGVLEDCRTDSTKVVDLYETSEYFEIMKRRYRWVQMGLMLPNGSTNKVKATDLMKQGKVFASSTNIMPGKETEVYHDAGIDVTCIKMTESCSTTSSYSNQWFIAKNSERPERAMQILNEMFTNPELANILANGVKGVHWESIRLSNHIIDYPEGTTADTTGYPSWSWIWPNELITKVWCQAPSDLWNRTIYFNTTAIQSPLMGFSWDNYQVLSEIAACNDVSNQYKNALECGEIDPAVFLPKYIDELKKAGISTIIKEKQRQVNEWLKSKE